MLAAIGLILFVIGWFALYIAKLNFWMPWAENTFAIGSYVRVFGGALLLIEVVIWLIRHAV